MPDRHLNSITSAMLTTQRLQLRAFTDADYVYWTSIWNDPANQALFSEDLIAPMASLSTDELRKRDRYALPQYHDQVFRRAHRLRDCDQTQRALAIVKLGCHDI